MRLTRNTTPDGRCKYALVRLDKLREMPPDEMFYWGRTLDTLAAKGLLEYGEKGSAEEFFAIKLKDKNAADALYAYAVEAMMNGDLELGADVEELADRAFDHPDKHSPD